MVAHQVGNEPAASVALRLHAALGRVQDPEIPVSLADLGVLRLVEVSSDHVRVTLRTTRMACPGRQRMEADIRAAVSDVSAGLGVDVVWDPSPWRPADMTDPGRQALAESGYAALDGETPPCPYCGAVDIRSEGRCGGSPCKVPFTCRRCGSPFDALAGSTFSRESLPDRPCPVVVRAPAGAKATDPARDASE